MSDASKTNLLYSFFDAKIEMPPVSKGPANLSRNRQQHQTQVQNPPDCHFQTQKTFLRFNQFQILGGAKSALFFYFYLCMSFLNT